MAEIDASPTNPVKKRLSIFTSRSTRNNTMTTPLVESPVSEKPRNGSVLNQFRDTLKNKLPITDLSFVSAAVDAISNTESLDDRKMLLEHALTFVSRWPEGDFSTKLQAKIVQLLYNDLAHPAPTSIGNQYAWRTADGSYNNIQAPDMGKAGTPYSRSVQQTHPLPKNQLPDASLVFDTLLKREGFVKHPAGLSSLFFSFAALVIHSVFRTSHQNVHINETSSYVDLSPLYGHNQAAQDLVRVRDGRGLLHPDVFAEDRLLLLPPAVCALLVLFSRNHNYVARKLLEINERGSWQDPSKLSPDRPEDQKKLLEQEEEIFQIARLINCGWFATTVFSDYFSCILGLVRTGNTWSLLPFGEMRMDDHTTFERGRGNICSAEFNCLYRWHATTSEVDERWVKAISNKIFEGKPIEEVTPTDFKLAARKMMSAQPSITEWTFGTIHRQADGSFRDEDLAQILQEATEHPAAAFRARGTPEVMRLHEIMGIEQNRAWGVCSLNDFRQYLGLKPYKTFLEWNSNPEIADAAEKLYGDIEYLELYVGLQAEEAKPVMDGAGLCPGYTISRAILSDAIALTRGDRFYTYDYTPYNMTAWGFADCQRDPNAFGFGSTLGRLFTRTLPRHYNNNSVYTFFPLMTPESMEKYLPDIGCQGDYDLARPKVAPEEVVTKNYAEVGEILHKKDEFVPPYAAQAAKIIKGSGFFTATTDDKEQAEILAILNEAQSVNMTGEFFLSTTKQLIASKSYALVGGKVRCIDVVRDIFKVVPTLWAATDVGGIHVKAKDSDDGDITSSELYDALSDIYTFVFLDVDAAKYMVLQKKCREHVEKLTTLIKEHLDLTAMSKLSIHNLASFTRTLSGKSKSDKSQHELVKKLYDRTKSLDQVANTLLAIMVSTIDLSLALTNVMNVYLDSEHEEAMQNILTSSDPKASVDAYVLEAFRLDPPFRGVHRVATKDSTIGSLSIPSGTRLFLDIAAANFNEDTFPNPHAVDLSRSRERYLGNDGLYRAIGENLTVMIINKVLRGIFAQTNIRRAPGQSGQLKRFREHASVMQIFTYLDKNQLPTAWPSSFVMQYDVVPSVSK
ncbi:hypothetical protein PC9H_006552 [Pleurotus ostreatus]|uniref:Linoleate diol synthase n=1 Tax=Pleurotus ostreatus TaxID=5322 RepID=A0A8H6ZWF0_PLEOS|nr:uncharacterized protein PC9H_006552 [Pleurotus ostreatus]KAF7430838.1 hypothetical protein PC9H_006552 [Pleurotus ostreatus]KAJ8695200.1 hypothetical protein PTI98_007815 [Pleurotus ostreatus]